MEENSREDLNKQIGTQLDRNIKTEFNLGLLLFRFQ